LLSITIRTDIEPCVEGGVVLGGYVKKRLKINDKKIENGE